MLAHSCTPATHRCVASRWSLIQRWKEPRLGFPTLHQRPLGSHTVRSEQCSVCTSALESARDLVAGSLASAFLGRTGVLEQTAHERPQMHAVHAHTPTGGGVFRDQRRNGRSPFQRREVCPVKHDARPSPALRAATYSYAMHPPSLLLPLATPSNYLTTTFTYYYL